MHAHERSRNHSGQRNPPFLDLPLLWEVLVSDLSVVLGTVGVPRVYKVGPVGDHVVRQLQL